MKVSIIIPCFRQGRYLAAAIDSCLAQTYKDIEIIVVNDGSDDNTNQVTAGYGDRIHYIHKRNGGLCAARNTGIAAARGVCLKFLDADDHLAPEQIEWQMRAINGNENRVSFTALRAYKEHDPDSFIDYLPRFRALLPDMLNQPDCAPHSMLCPATLVRAVRGFSEDIAITGDWNFWCKLGRLSPDVCCDERVGGYYRLRRGSMSTNRQAMTREVALQLIAMHDEFEHANSPWFGQELLNAENATYRRMIVGKYGEPALEKELFTRIKRLWRLNGPPEGVSRKFLLLNRAMGFKAATRFYASYVQRQLSKRPTT